MKFGMKKAFDVNTAGEYKTVREKLAVATSALNKTPLGRGGAVRAEVDNDRVRFLVTATRISYDSVDEALNAAAGLNVNEVVSFGKRLQARKVGGSFGEGLTNKYGAFASILDDMHSKFGTLNTQQRKILKDAGIDLRDLKNLELDIVTMGSEKGGIKDVASRIQELRGRGQLHGITMMDDEGARVLSFRMNEKTLNTYQANLLLSVTGHDLTDRDAMLKYLETGNVDKIASMFEKSEKRMRAYVSARDMSLADGELESLIRKFSSKTVNTSASTLADVSLIVDPQYEILMKYAHGSKKFKQIVGDDLGLYYRNLNAARTMNDILADLDTKFSKTDINAFGKAIKDFDPNSVKKGKWASDELKDYLLNSFAKGNTSRQKLVENIYKSIEHSYDGSDQLNRKFLGTYTSMLREKIDEIDNGLPSMAGDAAHKARIRRQEIKSVLNRIEKGELGQITGRGRISIGGMGDFNIKNAFDASDDFIQGLSKYGLIINRFSLKRDTNIAGASQSLILSGIGDVKDVVYADPVAAAFHPEVFADKNTIKAIEARSNTILSEYKAVIESGVVPEKVKRILQKQADVDIDIIPANMRSSAMRNREFARSVLEMLNAGMSPNDTPAMMSMLHNAFATQAFREKGEFIQPVLPDTYRYAIDVEKVGSATGRKPKLRTNAGRSDRFGGINIGGSFQDVDGEMKYVGGKTFAEDADILKFRIEGHKILLPNNAPGKYFNSLGGFDLDDKGLPKLLTYTDNEGRNRLGFYLFRQPSGPEEIIFARAQLDQQTIKSLFDNTYFRSQLEDTLNGVNNPRLEYELLREAINSGRPSNAAAYKAIDVNIARNQAEIEGAIVDILGRMQNAGQTRLYRLSEKGAERIGKKGSTLALGDLVDEAGNAVDAKFTRRGIFKALFDDGAFDMSKDILDVFNQYGVRPKVSKQLTDIYQGAGDQSEKFEKMLKLIRTSTSDEEASAIMSTAKEVMQMKRVQQSEGLLGVYVNRSMIVGSTLNQYEDFLAKSGVSQNIQDLMMKKYGIGMLAQETAIDLSVNFSRAKTLSAETAALFAEQFGGLNEEKAGLALAKIAGLGTTGGATLEDIGGVMISNLGKQIGFARAISKNTSEELLMGIDEFLLRNKTTKADRMNILEGIVIGMEDAKNAHSNRIITGDILHDSLDDDLERFKKVLSKKNDDEIEKVLIERFALSSRHEYSSLAKLHAVGSKYEGFFETIRRSFTARIASDPSLTSAITTAEERATAEYILDKNRKNLDTIFGFAFKDRKNLTNTQIYDLEALTLNTGKEVFGQLRGATQMQNVSMKGLITAIDQIVAESNSKIDIGALRVAFDTMGVPLDEEMSQTVNKIWQARALRRMDFLDKFDQTNALNLRDLIESSTGKITAESVKERAKQILDQGTFVTDLEENILKAITGNASEISDDIARQQAQLEANILDSMLRKEDLIDQGVVDDLLEVGQQADLTDEMRDLGVTDDLIDSVRRSVGDDLTQEAVSKAKYKRLTKKVIKEDLGDILSSPMVKKGAIGLGALIVGSFIYTGMKDRSVDDMSGPPLLPGGSAYESNYPARTPEIQDFAGQGYNPGVSYKVNLYGDQNAINQFRSSAGGLVNGNMNTTMYNRIPDVNRDQYSSMASMY